MKTILVTGSSGFIGYHLCKKLLKDNNLKVIGLDNMNDYYDVKLKETRLNELKENKEYTFIKCDITDKEALKDIFEEYKPNIVVNLAAYAGVRYSIDHRDCYFNSNIIGFYNIIDLSKEYNIEHFIYASSSSVYGDHNKVPYNVNDNTDYPVSFYAATKKCDEIISYSFSKLYNLKCTGLRFFTVYGPSGRPDMSYSAFVDKFLTDRRIELGNNGKCLRDFTYVDDIVNGIYNVITKDNNKLYSIYNIGNGNPITMYEFAKIIKEEMVNNKMLSKDFDLDKHIYIFEGMVKGDVKETYADVSDLIKDYDYKPNTDIKDGMKEFIKWYKDYYNIDEIKE